MYSKEIVESFIQEYSKKFRKFFISMIIVDVVVLAILIFASFNMDKEYGTYVGYTAAAIIMITLYVNMKIHFGSFKGYTNGSYVKELYNKRKKKFEKIQKKYEHGKIDESTFLDAQKSFEELIAQIALRIKSSGE